MSEPLLEIKDLVCGYAGKEVLRGFDLTIRPGEIWCILGRNGIGKTTLFRTILGSLPKIAGTMKLEGRPVEELSRRELARRIAYVPQNHTPPFDFTVREVVVMGRNAYMGTFRMPGAEDERVAEEVLKELEITHLADQDYTKISGGERQMVLIARAMAQKPKLLMMDEPAANLDYGNQMRMLRKMKQLAGADISIIFTSHDPQHAFLCNACVAAMEDSGSFRTGAAGQVITEELLQKMYGIHTFLLKGKRPGGETVRSIVPYL